VHVLRRAATDEIIGAVRLTPRRCESVGDLYFVRSLCVASEWRRRGLGTRLLRAALEETAGWASYAFPFAELAPLYRAAGFRELPAAEAPAWLEATRAKVAGQQRGRVVLMVREWPGATP
jgi:predicted N-acetyltransferase YhbS